MKHVKILIILILVTTISYLVYSFSCLNPGNFFSTLDIVEICDINKGELWRGASGVGCKIDGDELMEKGWIRCVDIVEKYNIEICNKGTDDYNFYCISTFAIKNKDLGLCENIKNDYLRINCEATDLANSEYGFYMDSPWKFAMDLSSIKVDDCLNLEEYQDRCLLDLAVYRMDPKICANPKALNKYFENNCYYDYADATKKTSHCKWRKDKYDVADCYEVGQS